MRQTKNSLLRNSEIPVKWNIRDLKDYIKKNFDESAYDSLLSASDEVRARLLNCLVDVEAELVVCVLVAYSTDKETLISKAADLTRFSFVPVLQRFGFVAKDASPGSVRVTLDWPPGGNPTAFNQEYNSGWAAGRSLDNQPYHCGPLSGLSFDSGPLFGSVELNPCLQLADLVVGITKEWARLAITGKSKQQRLVKGVFPAIIPIFHASDTGDIVKFGIVPASNSDLDVEEKFRVALRQNDG